MDDLLKDIPKSRKVLELKEELIGNMSRSAEADGTNNVLTIILKSIGVK